MRYLPVNSRKLISWRRVVIAAAVLSGLAAAYLLVRETQLAALLSDPEALRSAIEGFGFAAPAVVIAAMAVAIVFSPIPSGPIALAAGALFGPLLGAVTVIIGSVLGALIAFLIGRAVGRPIIARWKAAEDAYRWFEGRSQNWLMLAVFASRLVPFISFDAVSYVAGVTPLRAWRFVVATVAGVTPVSFALTYAGDQFVFQDATGTTIAIAVVGLITLVPIVVRMLLGKRQSAAPDRTRPDDSSTGENPPKSASDAL